MYKIFYYTDKKGNSDVDTYLNELKNQNSKDSKIKLKAILHNIDMLSMYGTRIGTPFVKHLEGDLWELRPLNDRVFFVAWRNNSFVLLHHFVKKTQKTPKREIEKAKREYADIIERGVEYE